jgi:hypothetical protein
MVELRTTPHTWSGRETATPGRSDDGARADAPPPVMAGGETRSRR